MDVRVGILRKGDEVVSVFPYGEGIAIAVRKKATKVDIVLLETDNDGLLRVGQRLVICEGDDEVEVVSGHLKASKF